MQQTPTKRSRVPVEVCTLWRGTSEGRRAGSAGTHLRASSRRDFAPLQCAFLPRSTSAFVSHSHIVPGLLNPAWGGIALIVFIPSGRRESKCQLRSSRYLQYYRC